MRITWSLVSILMMVCKMSSVAMATASTCRDRLGYFRPNDFKISSCSMCYIYLVLNNPEFVLNTRLTVQAFHNEPYGLKPKTTSGARVIYPDVDNTTTVNRICRKLDEDTCSRWVTCCEDAWECCKRQLVRDRPHDGGIYCPQTFDGWECWDFTEANTTVTQACPSFLTLDKNAMSSKTCNTEGRWETGANTSLEYTVYDNCSKPKQVQIYWIAIILGLVINAIGIFLLIPAICVFMTYSTLRRQQRIKIHVNLFGSILLASILSLIWDVAVRLDRLNNLQSDSVMYAHQEFCKTLNIVHRFSRASMIFWMSCEGFYLHQLLVNTFTQPRHLYGYCLYGWGTPSLLFCLYAIIRKTTADDSSCWVTPLVGNHKLIDWFLIFGPTILCLLANMLFLINIIKLLFKKMIHRPNEPSGFRRTIKATLLLIPLFGLHQFCLIYRPGSVTDSGYNVYEIFSAIILNSQGIMVAILFCFINKEVQTQLQGSYKSLTRKYSFRRRRKHFNSSMTMTSSSRRSSFSTLQLSPEISSQQNGYSGNSNIFIETAVSTRPTGHDNIGFENERTETNDL